jgi:hypothetical protein
MPPYPVIEPEERKNTREIYRSRARDDARPQTWNHADLAANARKVGVMPGSPIFAPMVALPEDEEGCHGGDASPVLPHAQGQEHPPANHGEGHIKWVDPGLGRGQSAYLVVSDDGHWHAVITKRPPYRLLYVWQAAS